ncbi:T-lymphocyte activation antigen CD86 isoform X1 [Alexandromys fortis]|uniref:T-lymphocyte activation antigen CD86 isoform X1 n=1 Tax=Alexandromys fortis TaxID=100897 RepID=UPI0021535A20|nr:T-lymphocyte activation antigen CD86 isoform X1 [Microtus fortis]
MYVLKTCAACTMVLGLLFVTVFVLSDAAAMKRQAYFNRTAYLPCHPTKAQNMSLSELVVFWQDQKKSVLYEHYFGREKLDNVNAKYLNRTSFDGENWTLGLHNVQIKDMGLYDCFIQKKTPKGSVILQQTYTELSVVANFSEPKMEVQYKDRNSGINLTCSSKQGFPKPTKMYVWIINSTNSTNEYSDEMLISQDNVTELFTVSINFSIPFPDDVWSVTAVCVLETESMRTSSTPQDIVLPRSESNQDERKSWIAAVVTGLLIFALVLVYLRNRYKRKQERPGIS